ncbi:MAG: hypothetical protein IJP30_05770 [Clostridia bacterium]|nr:hypothetical protein [Clostridia bacterium]
MRKRKWMGWVLWLGGLAAGGCLLHFLYGWLPYPATALFAPVRESLWEHGKIVFWPLLFAARYMPESMGSPRLFNRLAGTLIAVFGMYAVAYTKRVLLGVQALWPDILLFVVSLAVGLWLFDKLRLPTAAKPVVYALTAVYTASILLFSFAVPGGMLFMDMA